MIKGIILLILFTIIAFIIGKLVSKLKLPSILGWLITGMIIGPHALNWMNSSIMDAQWYHILTNVGEILVGMLIGTELIIEELKKSGKQIVIICLFEGMTAFILVAIAFFIFADIPMSIALVFGAIALATAPAPSLSIVKEYNAEGPVSKTLIPLAALDDVLGLIVFFSCYWHSFRRYDWRVFKYYFYFNDDNIATCYRRGHRLYRQQNFKK